MNKGFAGPGLMILIVVIVGVAGYFVFVQKFDTQIATSPTPSDGVFCTQDAKLCPDGSYVGRTGPQCEFTPCPTSAVKDETIGWKTYTGTVGQIQYQVSYPEDWRVVEQTDGGVGFGPKWLGSDVVWTISPENQKSRSMATVVADIEADARKDKIIQKKNMTLPSGFATSMTMYVPDTDYGVRYVIVQVGDVVYTIFAGPQLGIEESFEQFYSSLKTVNK